MRLRKIIPLIIGLFSLLRSPLTYISQSNMIMAVHESFYWIADLSQPDNWILPILAGITTYLTTATTSGTSGSSALNGVAMKYLYPVMIILLARSFPAGLSIYWVVGNGFAVVQTIIMNKMRAKDDLEPKIEDAFIKKYSVTEIQIGQDSGTGFYKDSPNLKLAYEELKEPGVKYSIYKIYMVVNNNRIDLDNSTIIYLIGTEK